MSKFKGTKPADHAALQAVICELASLRNHVYVLGAPENPEVEEAVREADEHLHHASLALCTAIDRLTWATTYKHKLPTLMSPALDRLEKSSPCPHVWRLAGKCVKCGLEIA